MGRLGRGAEVVLAVVGLAWLGLSFWGAELAKADDPVPAPLVAVLAVDVVAIGVWGVVHFAREFNRPTRKPIRWWHKEWIGMGVGPPVLVAAGLWGVVAPGDVSRLVWFVVLGVGLAATWAVVRHVSKPVDHDV